MEARRIVVAAGLAAILTTGAAAAGTAPKKVWVGTLHLSYIRHYEKETPNGIAVERDSRSVVITNRRNGTAFASGRIRSTTAYPCSNGASSGRTESWDVGGAVRPLTVTFVKNRYQVRYTNPSRKTTVEQRDCTGRRDVAVTEYALDVGFQLYGRANPRATGLTGIWKHEAACGRSCVRHEWSGRWDLRLVTLAR